MSCFVGHPVQKLPRFLNKPLKKNHASKGAVAVIVCDLPYDALHLKRAMAYKRAIAYKRAMAYKRAITYKRAIAYI